MAEISNRAWSSISESDYEDAVDFCEASLINLNQGPRREWTKANCKLPVYEPRSMGRRLNRNAVHAAAAVLAGARGGVDAPPDAKRQAARKLIRLYRELDEEPPESLKRLAGV
ncbi:hypothetical protein HRbin27_00063 [bacterium HR27]|nr:hypothetical protein HRbin27_00063 [bacterium HR27]